MREKIGHNPWQKDHHKATDAKRRVQKRCKYTSILNRKQQDEIYRASQTAIGWTETYVKYLEFISKIDIRYNVPCRI